MLIFPNFSAGNKIVFNFLTDFEMYTIFLMSFYSKFSCLKKANTAVCKSFVFNHPAKNKCF